MARWTEPTEAQERAWREFKDRLPPTPRAVAERIEPWSLYRLKSTGHRVTVASIFENGMVSVNVTGEFNLVGFARTVFGIDPDDLEPCDLPGPDEPLGEHLTPDEVGDNLDELRLLVRPDLWTRDDSGNVVRKQ